MAALESLKAARQILLELIERDGEHHADRKSLALTERRLGNSIRGWEISTRPGKSFETAHTTGIYSGAQLDAPEYSSRTGRRLFSTRGGFQKLNRASDALAATEEAVKHYRLLLARSPNDSAVRKNLSSVLGNVAISPTRLKRLPKAP